MVSVQLFIALFSLHTCPSLDFESYTHPDSSMQDVKGAYVLFRSVLPVSSPVSGTNRDAGVEWNLTGGAKEREQMER